MSLKCPEYKATSVLTCPKCNKFVLVIVKWMMINRQRIRNFHFFRDCGCKITAKFNGDSEFMVEGLMLS